MTNLHTSPGAPDGHASLLHSSAVGDGRGKTPAGAAKQPVVNLRGARGCQMPCNPPRTITTTTTTTATLPPRAPSFPLYHPLHLTMTNPICSLSKNRRLPLLSGPPPLSFLTQRSSSHLSFTPPQSWSAQRDTLSLPGLAGGEVRGMAGKGKATGSPCGNV